MRRISKVFLLLAVILFAVGVVACESSYRDKKTDTIDKAEQKHKDDKVQKEQEMKKAKAEADKKAAEAAKAAKGARTAVDDIDCWGKSDPKAGVKTIEVNKVKYEIKDNYSLTAIGADPKKPLVFGVLTDLKSNIAENIKNLNFFFAEFKKAGVNVLLVAGDTSEKYDMLKPMFELLAKQGYLTLAIMGNREAKADYVKAMDEVQKTHKNLINMNRIRSANLGAVTLVSLPGYYDPNFIHNAPGCGYQATHVDMVKQLAAAAKNPVVLLSHGPPRGKGPDALDNAVEAGNVGDMAMSKLIADAKIPFGVFGNIHEAGGRAVGSDMAKVLAQNKPYKNLYLNPGPGDSDPWKMNDGTISRGMAGVMTITNGEASYKIIRVK